ncbi:MAG: transporter substrate-binding domain-containing protein [Flavobacteriales bacterium]|nr:transporter substrate-binding domain-containing protein [Flavobacteriales bacterium]
MKKILNKLLYVIIMAFLPLFSSGQSLENDTLVDDTLNSVDNKIFIARGDNNFPPFEFINEKGEPDGFNVDFFYALMKHTGLKYDLKLEAWDSVVYNYNKGNIDIITGTSENTKWEQPSSFGIPYFKLSLDILSRKNNAFYSMDAIKDKKIAIQKDTWTASYMDSINISDKIEYVERIQEAIKDLSNGKYDAVICTDLSSQYILNKEKIKNINVYNTHVEAEEYSVMVQKDADTLLSILNKGIYELKIDGTYDALYEKWFSTSNEPMVSSNVKWIIFVLILIGVIMSVFIAVLRLKVNRAILELQRREKDLKEKNNQLIHSFTAGHVIPFSWDIKNDRAFISMSITDKEAKYTDGSQGLPFEKMLLNVHPDDREAIKKMFFDVKEGKTKNEHHEMRYNTSGKYDQYNDYYDIYVMSEDEESDAAPEKLVGYMQNITKRKQAEKALAKNDVFLKEIMDAIPFPVQVKDVENGGRYTFWNKKSTEEYGNAIFKTEYDIMNAKDAERISEIDANVYYTGKTYSNREDFITNNGKSHRTYVQKSVIYSEGRRQILIVRWDINELLSLQDDLLKANKLNEMILNNASSGFVYISPDYKVEWENMSSLIGHGQTSRYIPGHLCFKTVHGKEAPCEDCIMQRAFNEKSCQYMEIKEDDGTIIKMVANPVFNEEGTAEGLVLRADDITVSRRMHEEVRINKEKAELANKLKSAFLANMSHEIRTPLNAIVGFSELMKTATLQEERDEYGRIISTNSDILLSLINEILDLSKIEAGCMELKNAHFDLSTMFRELEMTFSQRMHPGVKLICEIPYQNCIVNLDKKRMTQVVINFTSNAIKFTKEGSITMGYSFEKDILCIYVKDTGCGIKKEKQDRVFGRFEKLNDFAQGTGLGLAISKSIAEANKGIIGFDSVEDKGSTFWIKIPCHPVTENLEETLLAMMSEDKKDTAPSSDKKEKYQSCAEKLNILVAEDNDSNYLLVNSILRKEFNLVRAENGAEVLEQLQTLSPDIILMDMKMPILDGIETTKTIREMGLKMPVIAVTANAFDSDKAEALSAGCDDFLPKPLNRESLMSCLEKYIPIIKQ